MDTSLISDANALNKAVRQTVHDQLINKLKNPDELWKWRVVGGLFSLTFEHYDAMMDAYKRNRPISTLAFHARSLLELFVWTKYALDSDENIRRIDKDSLMNAKNIAVTLKKRSVEFDVEIAEARLANLTQLAGYQELSGSYLRTDQLPVEKEVTEYYKASNKMLSKLAHPSGFTIVGLIDESGESAIAPVIVQDACNWFIVIIKALAALSEIEITRKPDCK
jgi:hypothetical protein